jgi:polyhydroxyalkanoate synthesis repressor PhaR
LCQDDLAACAKQHGRSIMKSSLILIKKYGNRRLYDTAGSRYVNLDDLAALVRGGKEVRIVDAKTGRDLTRVTLTQIITEDARDKPTGLPLELLRQLIIASDEVRQEFLMWYLKSAFDTYENLQESMQSRLSQVQSAVLSPVDTMKRFLGAMPSPPPRTENDQESEVEALRKRVAELEARLKKIPSRGRRLGKKS